MKPIAFASLAFMLTATVTATAAAAPAPHRCASDAIGRATPLLRLHFEADQSQSMTIGDTVKVLPPIRALKGNGRFDVLEVWGYIYKAEYRMRFIYAQIPGSCLLMGQEILEASNPY